MSDVTATGIRFDPEAHRYFLGDVELLSVTRVLAELGLVRQSESEHPLLRGQAVHEACKLFDEDDLDLDSLDDITRPYLKAYKRFKEDMDFEVKQSEALVWSKDYGYAGRLDRVGEMSFTSWCYFGNLWAAAPLILEIKTGKVQPATALQLVAYAQAHFGQPVRRYAVALRDDATYRITEYPLSDFREDFRTWLSCLRVAQWKRQVSL